MMALNLLLVFQNTFTSIEANKDISNFALKVVNFVEKKIESVSDKEIKELDKFDQLLKDVLKNYYPLTGVKRSEIPDKIQEKNLTILKKFLTTPFLEKKLTALNQIKIYCETTAEQTKMCKWIIDEQIIDLIFQDSNPELISRSSSIISLLASKE